MIKKEKIMLKNIKHVDTDEHVEAVKWNEKSLFALDLGAYNLVKIKRLADKPTLQTGSEIRRHIRLQQTAANKWKFYVIRHGEDTAAFVGLTKNENGTRDMHRMVIDQFRGKGIGKLTPRLMVDYLQEAEKGIDLKTTAFLRETEALNLPSRAANEEFVLDDQAISIDPVEKKWQVVRPKIRVNPVELNLPYRWNFVNDKHAP
jgi:RimJ/RimL family protein N-acetyltransferase